MLSDLESNKEVLLSIIMSGQKSVNQWSLLSKQNANKINNVMSNIEEADIANLHVKIFSIINYNLHGYRCLRLTGKRWKQK